MKQSTIQLGVIYYNDDNYHKMFYFYKKEKHYTYFVVNFNMDNSVNYVSIETWSPHKNIPMMKSFTYELSIEENKKYIELFKFTVEKELVKYISGCVSEEFIISNYYISAIENCFNAKRLCIKEALK